MKGIAILIVVMGHVAQSLGGNHTFAYLIVVLEMPLFFTLSGILAVNTLDKPLSTNFRKKGKSLLLPMLLFGSVFALLDGTYHEFIMNAYHDGYWFLWSLFCCWVLFLPIAQFSKRFNYLKFGNIIELVLLLIPFVLYKLISNKIPPEISNVLTLNFTFTYYRFFIVGYYVGKLRKKGIKIDDTLGGGIVVVVISFILIGLCKPALFDYMPMTIVQLVLSVGLIYVLYIYYLHSHQMLCRIICWMGEGSLTIYVLHFFLKPFINLSFLTTVSEFFVFLMTLLVSIIVAVVCLIIIVPVKNNGILSNLFLGRSLNRSK